MDWQALKLSLELGALTILFLLPAAVLVGRWLATTRVRGKPLVEAVLALPLVLPPTVVGFYLLVAFSPRSWLGNLWQELFGSTLAFTFEGLLVASVLINLPFAIQPAQRAFEAIGTDLREAAASCGMSWWRTLLRVDVPLAWPGIVTGMILAFAHTLGEFGVVLMVGGNIPGETRTIAISIYDRVQAFDDAAAAQMAGLLLVISLAAIATTFFLTQHAGTRRG
jgi:molybdate transport system permease protein